MNETIFFKFSIPLFGFAVSFEVLAYAFMVESNGTYCLNGVFPGGLTAIGKTYLKAIAAFKRGFIQVVEDMAFSSYSFDSFLSEVNTFFFTCDEETKHDWKTAKNRPIVDMIPASCKITLEMKAEVS